jgi:hypothetical protein
MNRRGLRFIGIYVNWRVVSIDEALNHKDPMSQEKWREAINKEFQGIEKKEVWEVMKKEDIP